MFPSLSGKTSIRTGPSEGRCPLLCGRVSIPFREDLYSDFLEVFPQRGKVRDVFPSLSGKTSIRTPKKNHRNQTRRVRVSIPFREDLHSDELYWITSDEETSGCFHPFQGRPSFGHREIPTALAVYDTFPSLSGKTFIRTRNRARM